MRFNNILEGVFGSKPKIKILRAMLKVRAPLTGRKIAALSSLNHRTCLLSLKKLSYEGFISIRSAGKSKIYTLNADNIFLKNYITAIFDGEKELLPNIFKRVGAKSKGKISALILFGSIAEGREGPDSDIDICIIMNPAAKRKEVEHVIEMERNRILTEYGNDLSPYYISQDDFVKKYKKKNKLILNIAENGKIIMGKRFF
ncbi:MAG: nucleotidyltransferase domain-containing protein [bacterium]